MSTQFRWAVLLCHCQGTPTNQAAQQFFVNLFTAGLGGAVDYWSDLSFGELDLRSSVVFSWVTLPINTMQALTTRRTDAVNMGIKAHRDAGHDLSGIHQYLVYIDVPFIGQNITEGGQQGAGAVDGGRVLIDQGVMRGSFILHEMGHGHGLNHSRDLSGNDYMDPYCIMSADTFGGTDPRFQDDRFGPTGPALCSPYVFAKKWLPDANLVQVEGDGRRPNTTRLVLNPFERVVSVQPQVAYIHFTHPYATTFFIDYIRQAGWNRGLAQGAVVIRQYRMDGYSYYCGRIATGTGFAGGGVQLPERIYVDSQFDFSIQVHRVLADGPIELTVAPASAVQRLSVRTVAREKLGLTGRVSVRGSILQRGTNSVRKSLVEILGR